MRYVTYLFLAPILIAVLAGLIYAIHITRLKKKYEELVSEPAPINGREAVSKLMQQAGYEASFMIWNPKGFSYYSLNPFYGNAYIPDENLFVMRREIMDGKTLLSFCVGCQLAVAAIKYRDGNVRIPNAGYFLNEFAIHYKFNKNETENARETLQSNTFTERNI